MIVKSSRPLVGNSSIPGSHTGLASSFVILASPAPEAPGENMEYFTIVLVVQALVNYAKGILLKISDGDSWTDTEPCRL